jgi:hypothetical protein
MADNAKGGANNDQLLNAAIKEAERSLWRAVNDRLGGYTGAS